jgi:hypothetical protein
MIMLINKLLVIGFASLFFVQESIANDKLKKTFARWDFGTILLTDSSSINGNLLFYPEKGIVLIEVTDKIITYTAENLISFSFYDNLLSVKRNFVSIVPKNIAVGKKKNIYEVVLLGDLSLLRHQKSRSHCDGYFDVEAKQFIGYSNDFTYYFFYNSSIYPIKNFKKQFGDILRRSDKDIAMLMEIHGMGFSKINHQIKAISFFNNLPKTAAKLTSNE